MPDRVTWGGAGRSLGPPLTPEAVERLRSAGGVVERPPPMPRAAPRQPSPMGPALIAAPTPSLSLPARVSVKLSVFAHFEGFRRVLIRGKGKGK